MIAYGLTIAKCKMDKAPKKEDIINIRDRLFNDHKLVLLSFPVEAYELKKNKWLHYHACVLSHSFVKFKDIKYNGWSINLKWLKKNTDIINWCGYVQKHKVDSCMIKVIMKKVQRFKKDKKEIKLIPSILSFYPEVNK